MAMILRVRRETLQQKAYMKLKELIESYELNPGEILSVKDLSEQFGISRTPIREALMQLSKDDLVRYEPHKGARVASITEGDICHTYEIRKQLELYAFTKVTGKIKKRKFDYQVSKLAQDQLL